MASHDLNFAALLADRVLLLSRGNITAAGTPDEVMVPSVLERVYGVPIERLDRPGCPPAVILRGLKELHRGDAEGAEKGSINEH
jgi:iron complex transport system ATP-binding protein